MKRIALIIFCGFLSLNSFAQLSYYGGKIIHKEGGSTLTIGLSCTQYDKADDKKCAEFALVSAK